MMSQQRPSSLELRAGSAMDLGAAGASRLTAASRRPSGQVQQRAEVASLVELCLQEIVHNFESHPHILENNGATDKPGGKKIREKLFSLLPLDLPLDISSKYLTGKESECYWERSCRHSWPHSSLREHGRCWKRMFFETRARDRIEAQLSDAARKSAPVVTATDQQQQQPAAERPGTQMQPQHPTAAAIAEHTGSTIKIPGCSGLLADSGWSGLEAFLMCCRDHCYTLKLRKLQAHINWHLVCGALLNLTTLRITFGKVLEPSSGCVVIKLNLSNNRITADCVEKLAQVICKSECLEYFNIGLNNICAGVPKFLDGVLDSKSLCYLNLSCCGIDTAGAQALAAALEASHWPASLATVEMSGNPGIAPAAQQLSTALDHAVAQCAITELDLRHCNLEAATLEAVEAILTRARKNKRNKSIPEIVIAPNRWR
eukprot:m51a1_g1968 hypothetical protein (430) ;mRNA; r:1084483-1086170